MSKHVPVGGSLDGWMQQVWAQARLRRSLAHVAGALGAFTPVLALANPTGGQVVAGSATIGTAGSNGVVVNQNSQRASINWQQFSIGSNEYVQFNQPNSSSVVLNRVIGSNPSSIFGNIRANGQVFLINPNGILFAPGSSLDVSSLTASTLDISDANFMAGRYVFAKDPGAPDATVVNQGNVTVTSGGYVVLTGDYVENDGVINAQSGKVLLAAGGAATLTLDNGGGLISYKIDAPTLARLAGVDNAGTITANGGAVVMTADVANALTATAVNNSGLITAHSVSQQGGVIVLEAQGGGIENSGTLDASATQTGVAGGEVIVRGDKRTELTSTSVIDAEGDGAKGGFVDLSGHTLAVRGVVDLGKGGDLLIDPTILTIHSGSSAPNGGAGPSPSHSPASVGAGFIKNQLNAGANVELVANTAIVYSGPAHTLHATGVGNLVMAIGSAACGSGVCTGSVLPTVTYTNGSITLTGLTIQIAGDFTAHAGTVNGFFGHVTLGDVTARSITLTGEFINFGNLVATGNASNAISINAKGSSDDGGSLTGGKLTASNGGVHVFQAGGGSGISVGTLTAKKNISVIDGPNSTLLNLKVNGNVTAGSRVTLQAQNGGVTVAGSVKASSGSVFISAHTSASQSGGNISVTGGITAKGSHARVRLLAAGGGTSDGFGGGNITVSGAIKAAGSVTISASYLNSGHSFKVQTGNITAGASGAHSGGIQITMLGPDPVLQTGALLAQGPLHPCSSANEGCHGRTGDIVINTGGVSSGGTGSITFTSAKSSHGEVEIEAGSRGAITTTGLISAGSDVVLMGKDIQVAGITAGNDVSIGGKSSGRLVHLTATGLISAVSDVKLQGQSIQVAAITAGNDVSIVGNSSAGFVNIHATGLIKGKQVSVDANGNSTGYGSFGASIDLAGGVTATAGNITIVAKTTSGVTMDITTGALQAANGSISVGQKGGSGDITINGNVTAKAIDIATSASFFGGNITVNGGLTATVGHIQVDANSSAGSNGAGGNITVTGATKASHGSVSFFGRGAGNNGGNITVGNVTAAGGVFISGSFQGSAEAGSVRVQTGNVSGEYVQINATGNAPTITTGTLTATGTVSSAGQHDYVHVQLNPTTHASSGSINIGGLTKTNGGDISIDANLGAVNTAAITGGAGADVDVSGTTIHVAGAITAIGGSVCLTGQQSSGQTTKITVTGTIQSGMVQVKASLSSVATHGASINLGKVSSSLSGGIMIAATTLANVKTNVTVGSLHAGSTGHIDVTQQGISGGITVNGKITAGGPVQLHANAGNHSGGNVTVSGLISASNGTVSVVAKGGGESGGNIKLAAVTALDGVTISGSYTGNSVGNFTLQTGKITAEKATVTMTGKDPLMTVAGAKATGLSSSACDCGSGFVQLQIVPTGNSGSINVTGGITTAHGDVDLSGAHGVVNLGTHGIATGGSGGVFVSGGQVHLGSINAGGGISVTAVAVTGHAGSITAGATTLMTGKYVKLDLSGSAGTKGTIAIGGATATGTTGSSLGGKVIIDANMGTKKVTVNTGALTAAASVSVSVNDASGSASLGKLDAPTVHVSIANGNLTVGQLVHSGASLTASNGSITDTTTGSLNLVNDKFNTTHGVHLKAGTNIILTNDSFGAGGLSASAGGKLVETSSGILDVSTQILKAKQLVLSAATIELGAAKLTASSIQLSATSINNASGNGSIVAAKGTIHATNGVFLANENIVVSGAGPLISAASVDLDNAVVSGTGVLSVKATGNLDASSLHVKAGGFTANGGSVDLTNARITATKAVTIKSGKNVDISGAQIAGSAVGISAGNDISDGSGAAGALTGGAGGLALNAKGNVQLAGETLTFGAGNGSISATGSLEFADAAFGGVGTATLHAGQDISLTGAKLTLSGITMNAVGGSIDLTGLTANVSGQITLHAKQDIVLSGVHITTGIFAASASGTIHNGGAQGAITADAMKFDAKKDIDMSSTVLTIGAGAVTGVTGDTQMLQLLAALGLKPGSAAPNAAFLAGGSVTLGDLDITGNYLVLQGSSVSILGTVTTPTSGLLVEVRPDDPAQNVDVEDQTTSGADFSLSNKAFLGLFPGATIVIGDDAETGDVTIGTAGPFTLAGGTNLLFDTTGTITGLGNLLGTGLVGLLSTVAGSAGNNDVVTAGEIDPSTTTTSLGDQTDKKHLGHGGQGFGNGEGGNGLIGADTDTSSVCH